MYYTTHQKRFYRGSGVRRNFPSEDQKEKSPKIFTELSEFKVETELLKFSKLFLNLRNKSSSVTFELELSTDFRRSHRHFLL